MAASRHTRHFFRAPANARGALRHSKIALRRGDECARARGARLRGAKARGHKLGEIGVAKSESKGETSNVIQYECTKSDPAIREPWPSREHSLHGCY